jgi:hypothetical protein
MKAFISYRHGRTDDVARWLEDIVRPFCDQVFLDELRPQPGSSVAQKCLEEARSADVMYVVIGDDWFVENPLTERPRLFDPSDLVALEVSAAFRAGCLVVPVLVGDTDLQRLPSGHWPESLRSLAGLDSVRIPLSGPYPTSVSRAIVKPLNPVELNDGTTVLKRSQMYEGMRTALDEVPDGATIRLSSFQLGHPLFQPEQAIRAYHQALFEHLEARGRRIGVKRLVSIQTLKKLPWIDDLVEQFGNDNVDFNLRLYPSRPQWETEPELEPLPLQVQLIGGTVFVGGGRVEEREVTSDLWGIQIDRRARQGRDVSSFFERHHTALWNFAHDKGKEHSDLIENGKPNTRNIDNLKWSLCSSWLKHHARAVKDEDGLFELGARIDQELRSIRSWYKLRLRPGGSTPIPYRRNVIDEGPRDGKVEMMLAEWQKGGECWPHDHGGASGMVLVLQGTATIKEFGPIGRDSFKWTEPKEFTKRAGEAIAVHPQVVHSMKCAGDSDPLVTLHLYHPRPKVAQIVDLGSSRVFQIKRGGAYKPEDQDVLTSWDVRLT